MRRSPTRGLGRASAMILLVWVVVTGLALVPAWPGAVALAPTAVAPSVWRVEAWVDRADALAALALAALATLALFAIVSPFLQQTWLHALVHRDRPLSDALGAGAARYGRALVVSALLSPALALAVATTVLVPLIVAVALDGVVSDRALDLSALAATLPGLVLLAVWATWHDLARAALATHADSRAWDAVRRGFRATSVSALASYIVFFTTGATLFAIAEVAALSLTGVLATLVGQALVVGRIATRGAWLASASDRLLPEGPATLPDTPPDTPLPTPPPATMPESAPTSATSTPS